MAGGKALGRSLKMNAIITHSTNFKRMMGVAENSEEAICPSYILFLLLHVSFRLKFLTLLFSLIILLYSQCHDLVPLERFKEIIH